MKKFYTIGVMIFILLACGTKKPEPAGTQALQKVEIKTADDVEKLKAAGAEIVVQEKDYVIIRTDSMLSVQSISGQPVEEADFVQRLIMVVATDSGDLQKIVDTGIDLWHVKNDTVIARAFDLYIEKLNSMGFDVRILDEDAGNRGGKK